MKKLIYSSVFLPKCSYIFLPSVLSFLTGHVQSVVQNKEPLFGSRWGIEISILETEQKWNCQISYHLNTHRQFRKTYCLNKRHEKKWEIWPGASFARISNRFLLHEHTTAEQCCGRIQHKVLKKIIGRGNKKGCLGGPVHLAHNSYSVPRIQRSFDYQGSPTLQQKTGGATYSLQRCFENS